MVCRASTIFPSVSRNEADLDDEEMVSDCESDPETSEESVLNTLKMNCRDTRHRYSRRIV